MPIESILVVTDFSSESDIAVDRASRLAQAHDAALTLMYAPAGPMPAALDPGKRLAAIARQLEARLALRVATVSRVAGTLQGVAQEAARHDLLVFPARTERSVAAFFLGQPLQRLLRLCAIPVLVARLPPRAHYRRILVAVDFRRGCEGMVDFASELDPLAQLELFHAIDTDGERKLRYADMPDHVLSNYREARLQKAQGRALALTTSFDARRNRMLTSFGRGEASRQIVIQQERSDADLTVIGVSRSPAWLDFLVGSVAHRALQRGSSDVLMAPHDSLPATRRIAASRLHAADAQDARLAALRFPAR